MTVPLTGDQEEQAPPPVAAEAAAGRPATGSTATSVGAVDGPAHTGSGDQYNMFRLFGAAGAYEEVGEGRLRKRAARVVTEEQRNRTGAFFVPPPGFEEARSMLAGKGRTVIVSGSPGSGRRTAAVTLLDVAGESGTRFHELPDIAIAPGASAETILDPETVHRGDRVLLDLSADPGLLSRIQPALETYRDAVQAEDAYLAVVISQGQADELRDEFHDLIVKLGRPDGVHALEKHLRVQGTRLGGYPLRTHRAAAWAADARLGEIAHFARLVRDARLDGPNAGVGAWLTEALSALAERGTEVAKKVDGLSDSWERAVLLSAALLDGCGVDAVFTAAQQLMGILQIPEPEIPLLERAVFRSQLDHLGVAIRPDRTVGFAGLGYAAALRDCFWDGHPDLAPKFLQWADRCMRDRRMSAADRDAIAERLAEQYLRLRSYELLFRQVRRWATDNRQGASLAPQAAYALGEALLGPREAGRAARRQVYWWARENALPEELAQVLIAVCAGVMVETQPDEALVRLHHIARRGRSGVRRAAMDALLELAEKPPRFRQLLARLAEASENRQGSSRSSGQGWEADHELLWRLTEPGRLLAVVGAGPLTAGGWVRSRLVTALADALTDDDQLRRHTERLLQGLALGTAPIGLLDLLVEAGSVAGRLAHLYTVARRWALGPADPAERAESARAATALLERVNRAQGLEPIATGGAHDDDPDDTKVGR
ncbi:hypothetical protein ACFO4E_13220 [Nocardiopsis mangrovi]|uniref:Uncharacterized protein n=1 Tax=Nocardiopsis mangrovi TaxID=1179818 RepID=A0ABV9DXI0_9ACTN